MAYVIDRETVLARLRGKDSTDESLVAAWTSTKPSALFGANQEKIFGW